MGVDEELLPLAEPGGAAGFYTSDQTGRFPPASASDTHIITPKLPRWVVLASHPSVSRGGVIERGGA